MTPMIDIVMQLIIFFMFTSHFAQVSRSPVDLPVQKGEEASERIERAEVLVDLLPDGSLAMNRQAVTVEDVASVMRGEQMRAGAAGVHLLVRADQKASAELLNALATKLAAQGVRAWSLATNAEGVRR